VGSLTGLIVACLGWLYVGVGHGWTGAVYSLVAAVAAPLAAVAHVSRRSRWARATALALVGIGLVCDYAIVSASNDEGWSRAGNAMRDSPPLFYLWIVGWLSWQVVALRIASGRGLNSRSTMRR